jgi:hypothetical protein
MDSPLLPVAGVAAIATVGAYYALSGGESPVAAARRDLSGVVNPDPATLSPYARAETKFFTAPDAEGTLRLAKKGVASLKPTTVSRKKEKRFFFSFFFDHFFPLFPTLRRLHATNDGRSRRCRTRRSATRRSVCLNRPK